jgi:hypothetical protein
MTEGAHQVAPLDPIGAELFGANAPDKLENQIVNLRADVDLAASLWVRITSACGSQVRNRCELPFACSEGTTQEGSESLVENAFTVKTTTMFTTRCLGGFAV